MNLSYPSLIRIERNGGLVEAIEIADFQIDAFVDESLFQSQQRSAVGSIESAAVMIFSTRQIRGCGSETEISPCPVSRVVKPPGLVEFSQRCFGARLRCLLA